ncbi:pyridoxal phosphate-dependent aminotransferase [Sporosarcina sp. ACRSM]|uniref:pyridoxal phosphate-dependent aminotransferase n=1 Tax=Sporosarcina sp. ACRSM TaxID=2918216 RepID=UPI001EF72368|nr:pyridoxal phosphate-dependent aminotransferase [Sporosarcina sp. ACRSM]MCG7336098.1 pyridoxal phosphate-dependent aminotransferase [Sporosarcina sp. ACRSM]
MASISEVMAKGLQGGSWVRKLFDEGARLKKEFGEDQVFDFSLGNPFNKPPEAFTKALLEEVGQVNHGYIPNQGIPETRMKVAEFLSTRFNTEISFEHVVMTVGAGGALNSALKSILNSGEEVIVLSPYFAEYDAYIENFGGKVVRCMLNDQFEIDIEAVRQSITPLTKGIIINTPHNPTGTILSQENLNELGALLKEAEEKSGEPIYMLFDEPYAQLIFEGEQVNPFLSHNKVILASSFSKDLGIAGERLGYLALNKNTPDADLLISAFVYAHRTLGFVNAPALMQRAIAKMPDLTVDASPYKVRRDKIVEILSDAGFEFATPKGGFFVFPQAPIADDVEFCRHAAEKYKLLIVPGTGFGLSGHFRLCYSVPLETIENSREAFISLYNDFK